MRHKKYGKLTFSAWWNLEMEQTNPGLMLITGALLMGVSIAVRIYTGSPYGVVLELGIKELIPPIWLLTFLRTLSFLLMGMAAGFTLGYRERGLQAEKYKGGMFFVLLCVVELFWYPTLFGSSMLLLSLFEMLLSLFLSVVVTACFYRVSRFSGTIMLFHTAWLLYLTGLHVFLFFQI